jgi:protein-S-isoprenylcysteine O-methyltransferase Ste14
MRLIDIPPVWLMAALIAAYLLGQAAPVDLGALPRAIGTGLALLGGALIAAAAWAFLRAKSSIIPRDRPRALITSGVFRLSRNPIYLGDTLILAGLILRWDAIWAFPLVFAFAWLVDRRFIRQEEQFLREAFPEASATYLQSVRRWL